MKTPEEWIELAEDEYSKHGQKNRLQFIADIQNDALSEDAALFWSLGTALEGLMDFIKNYAPHLLVKFDVELQLKIDDALDAWKDRT